MYTILLTLHVPKYALLIVLLIYNIYSLAQKQNKFNATLMQKVNPY